MAKGALTLVKPRFITETRTLFFFMRVIRNWDWTPWKDTICVTLWEVVIFPGSNIYWEISPPPSWRGYQLMSFGGKNMKRAREQRENVREKEERGKKREERGKKREERGKRKEKGRKGKR
jgi:hypothetical protein